MQKATENQIILKEQSFFAIKNVDFRCDLFDCSNIVSLIALHASRRTEIVSVK